MRIWCDILTPGQLLFFEHIAGRLRRNHQVLCTSPKHDGIDALGDACSLGLKSAGRCGGTDRFEWLRASTERMKALFPTVRDFAPDLTVSCASVEAARMAFGLGVRHVSFCEREVRSLRMVVPLVQKLLIPWIIPKGVFTRYGVGGADVIPYRGIAAAFASRQAADPKAPHEVTVVVQADTGTPQGAAATEALQDEFPRDMLTVSGGQDTAWAPYEGASVFVAEDVEMVARAALLGVPVISYGTAPDAVGEYLTGRRLIRRETRPRDIACAAREMVGTSNRRRAERIVSRMEDPFDALQQAMDLLSLE